MGLKTEAIISNPFHTWRNLPWTKIKIFIAGLLYRVLSSILGKHKRTIKRSHINFEIDLAEGIDLSLFLFGGFQNHVIDSKWIKLSENSVVLDIGANSGVMALQYARKLNNGKVYAFEPTQYALDKLKKNVSLNPELAPRIHIEHCFLSDKAVSQSTLSTCSSWPVDGSDNNSKHPVHGGVVEQTNHVPEVRLDDFFIRESITRIDLVKIDVDGHELKVLKGAEELLARFRPTLVFEVGNYLLKENKACFEDFLNIFEPLNYSLYHSEKNTPINRDNYDKIIPEWSTIDVVAVPKTSGLN